jgi:hypothetical protein
MSLKDELLPDFEAVFTNPTEFGEGTEDPLVPGEYKLREFMFVNKIFTALCVWDKDHMKQRFIVQQQGVFIGDVMLFIATKYFKQGEVLVEPKPEEILYSPKEVGWIISEVTEAGDVYEIALVKLMT